jgi:hypothetical protein
MLCKLHTNIGLLSIPNEDAILFFMPTNIVYVNVTKKKCFEILCYKPKGDGSILCYRPRGDGPF